MKRIIDGKRYNTETAEYIANVSPSGYYGNDFRAEDTQLYRTARGNWFLAGEGGPLSRWARSAGNGYTGGKGLRPVSASEARSILELHGYTAKIEQYFAAEIADA